MKIVRKAGTTIPREDAHGGEGGRKVLVADGELQNPRFEAMTKGFLAPGASFSWHSHHNTEEIMFVLAGSGVVRDREGEYPCQPGDVFVFPSDIEHEIQNSTDGEGEYVFVRMRLAG